MTKNASQQTNANGRKPPAKQKRQARGRLIAVVLAGLMALSLAAYYFQAAGPSATQVPSGPAGGPETGERYVQEGNRVYDAGDYAAAIRWYEKALPWRGQDPAVLTDLGTAYFYRRPSDPRKAIEYYDRALAVDPAFANALFNKGIVLWHGLNDPKAAIPVWERLLAALPANDPAKAKVQESLAAAKEAAGQRSAPPSASSSAPAATAPSPAAAPGSKLSSGFGR